MEESEEEVKPIQIPWLLAVLWILSGGVCGYGIGRWYTESKYRDVATCPACDGRGVVTTKESTDSVESRNVETAEEISRQIKALMLESDRLMRAQEDYTDREAVEK